MQVAEKLLSEQLLFLKTLWEQIRIHRESHFSPSFQNKEDSARIELHDQLPNNFDPSAIDWRYYDVGKYITLLAVKKINRKDSILAISEKIVKELQKRIKSNNSELVFVDIELAKPLNITPWEAYLACKLLVSTGLNKQAGYNSTNKSRYQLTYKYAKRILNFTTLENYLHEFESGNYDIDYKLPEVSSKINSHEKEVPFEKKNEQKGDILDIKPNVCGIGLNLNVAWRRVKQWFTQRKNSSKNLS